MATNNTAANPSTLLPLELVDKCIGSRMHMTMKNDREVGWSSSQFIDYEIIGEGSQISTSQKRESTVSWLLIGRNLIPFPDNFVLYSSTLNMLKLS